MVNGKEKQWPSLRFYKSTTQHGKVVSFKHVYLHRVQQCKKVSNSTLSSIGWNLKDMRVSNWHNKHVSRDSCFWCVNTIFRYRVTGNKFTFITLAFELPSEYLEWSTFALFRLLFRNECHVGGESMAAPPVNLWFLICTHTHIRTGHEAGQAQAPFHTSLRCGPTWNQPTLHQLMVRAQTAIRLRLFMAHFFTD